MLDHLRNVVIITCHDLGRFVGLYGVTTVETPNLDRLAERGIAFTQAFSTAPQCSPSRASIFTGKYPHSNGVLGLTHGEFGWDLHPDEHHLAQILGSVGYTTCMIGILHEARSIERCGFDKVSVPGYDARETSGIAVQALRRLSEQDRPFYLQLGYHEPHRVPAPSQRNAHLTGFTGDYITPEAGKGVTVPGYIVDDAEARQEIAELQGAVNHLDAAVGIVLDEIARLGLDESTILVFTTDHGLALPRAKCSLYDPGIEVAMIMRVPGHARTDGHRSPSLVSNIDLLPTILDLAGVGVVPSVHGRSLSPLINEPHARHRDHIFAEMTYHDYYHPQRCVRTDRYKLILNFTTAPSFMDPSQSWHRRVRPVVPEEPALAFGPPVELYDLQEDPLEWENLADHPEYRRVREELTSLIGDWMSSTGDPLLDGAVTSPRHRRVVADLNRANGVEL